MNKSEIVAAMAEKMEENKLVAEKALEAFQEVVKEGLARGEKIQMIGFGSFEVTERAERIGHNPKDGSKILIPACKSPKFKAGKALKDLVNA